MAMIKVCLVGLGKTGKEVAKTLLEQKDIKLVSVVCSPQSKNKGKDLGEVLGMPETGIKIESSDRLEYVIFHTRPDVVVDFSTPEATIRNAKYFSKMKVNIVVGTTGFRPFGIKRLYVLTRKYKNGIIYAPNITLGVNVLMLLTNIASTILNNYDFQITEIHQRNKKDAPSGTALKIAGEIQKGLINANKKHGESKYLSNIPINAVRAGGVVGKHKVLIVGDEDQIEISHESFSRKAFAEGALRAVRFIYGKSGFFEMSDVLDMEKALELYLERNKKRKQYRMSLVKDEERAVP